MRPRSTAVLALDARLGLVLLADDGELWRVEERELLPPASTIYATCRFRLRRLRDGVRRDALYRADGPVDAVELPERELEYLYRSDTGYVLIDPGTHEEYVVPDLGGLPAEPRPNERLLAAFWGGRPVSVRPATGLREP